MRALVSWFVGRKDVHPTYGTLLRDSDHIIALSARHLDAFEMAYRNVGQKPKLLPAPSFVHISEEDPQLVRRRGRDLLGVHEFELAIIYYGFLYPLKGVETLVSAFGQLPDHTRLLIVGGAGDGNMSRTYVS